MRSARLLHLIANLAQLGSLTLITNRQDWKVPGKAPYVLMHYKDSEPAKNYCKGSTGVSANCPYSNATILVDDCVALIRFLRGNSYRFELGNGDNKLYDFYPWLPAVGFGTCDFSVLPSWSNWLKTSVGSLEIEHTIFKSILMSHGPYMHATCGVLLNCTGDHLSESKLDGNDLEFFIHNAQVDHKIDPAVNVTNGFATTMSHSATASMSTSTQL